MSTIKAVKSQAKRLRTHLAANNISLSHSQSLEAVAALHNYKDWNTASALLSKSASSQDQSETPLPFCVSPEISPDNPGDQLENLLCESPTYLPLVVKNRGLGSLSGWLNAEGKLLVENTHEAMLITFMRGDSSLQNPENLLFVVQPSKLSGSWKYEGRDNSLASSWISPPFIFSRKDTKNIR